MGADFIHEGDFPDDIAFEDLPVKGQEFFELCLPQGLPVPETFVPRCRIFGRNNTHYDGNISDLLGHGDGRRQLSIFLTLMASNHNIEGIGLCLEGKALSGDVTKLSKEQRKILDDAAEAGSLSDAMDAMKKANMDINLHDIIHIGYETRTKTYTGVVILDSHGEVHTTHMSTCDLPQNDCMLGSLQGFFARANQILIKGVEMLEECK